ncbi:hypothetical protein BGZ96_002658 [Linnemannia gamsii]|uniref:Chromo domain-containing protein n=1 Tax=Linnemannia gamsii TaxID=64522 RepID=A0ABQ7JKH2_9FUNG|nr:hypothetical protein BGZ96_002658 [Linnemannia gamsii]
MDGTYVKTEPRDDRSSTVLDGLSSKDKDKPRNKAEAKKKLAKGNASGADGTSDLDTPGSDSDNSNDIEEDSDVYEVEKVVGHRYDHQNTLSYHIKWKGYPDEESTWEHESQVFCVAMVKDYWKQYVEQGGNRSDLQGAITRPTSSTLTLSGRRKSTTSSVTVAGNKHSSSHNSKGDKAGGKAGSGKGGSGGRSGRISPEPLLPDLSPLVKSSAAAAVTSGTMTTATTTTITTATTGGTKHTSSKRARTRSPERQLSTLQSSQRDTSTFVVPTSTAFNKSLTSSTAKMAKITSESWKGTSTSTTGGVTTTMEQQQQSRDSAPPRKLTAVGPVLMTEENWTPPSHWDSWDGHVERVEAIETRSADRHDRSTMFVHLRWKNGDRLTLHPLREIHDKAPRRLIDFYEGHLQFQESG